jgi:hypothetical protein
MGVGTRDQWKMLSFPNVGGDFEAIFGEAMQEIAYALLRIRNSFGASWCRRWLRRKLLAPVASNFWTMPPSYRKQ